MNIEQHIIRTLTACKSVMIPGLGTFIIQQYPAKLDLKNKTVLPPSYLVLFNEMMQYDDGQLVSMVEDFEDINSTEAKEQIANYVANIFGDLNEQKTFHFQHLGSLKLNKQEKLDYEVSTELKSILAFAGTEPVLLPTKAQPISDEEDKKSEIFAHNQSENLESVKEILAEIPNEVEDILMVESSLPESNTTETDTEKLIHETQLEPDEDFVFEKNEDSTVETDEVEDQEDFHKTTVEAIAEIDEATEESSEKLEVEPREEIHSGQRESIDVELNTPQATTDKLQRSKRKKYLSLAAAVFLIIGTIGLLLYNFYPNKDQKLAKIDSCEPKYLDTMIPDSTIWDKLIMNTPMEKDTTISYFKVNNDSVESLADKSYFVILASFYLKENAEQYANSLMEKNVEVGLISPFAGGELYRVSGGNFKSKHDAINKMEAMRNQFGNELWILNYK